MAEEEAQTSEKPQDFRDFLAELEPGQHVTVSVYRVPKSGRREFLETLEADFLAGDPLGEIKKQFGGGKYHLQVRVNGTIKAGYTEYIAGPPKPMDPEPEPEPEAGPEDPEKERLRRELEEMKREARELPMMELMGKLLETMQEIKRDLRNPPAQAQGQNPAEMALSIMGHVQDQTRPYLEALLERSRSHDPAELMIEGFKRGMDVTERLREGDNYSSVIREIGRPLVETLQKSVNRDSEVDLSPRRRGGHRPRAGAPAAGAVGAGTPTGTPDTGHEPEPDWYECFKPVIPKLISWARSGSNPELRARLILEDVPDQLFNPLARALRSDDFLQEFIEYVPEGAGLEDWFRIFFDELRAGIRYEDEPPVQTDQEPRAEPDPQDEPTPEPEAGPEPEPDREGEEVAAGADGQGD